MGLAGFCRNCLGDWIAEAGDMDRETGRAIVHGMPTAEWKARFHVAATPEQLARMEESMAKNPGRSEEHTSELQSLMRISYAVFCLKKKKTKYHTTKLRHKTTTSKHYK